MDIYDRINDLLEKSKTTRKKMANDLDISYHTINSLYARRTERIPFEMVQKIADYLGTTADYLAFGPKIEDREKEQLLVIFNSLGKEERKQLIEFAIFLNGKKGWILWKIKSE